jgi:2-iminobutanoate/2-iminopropanoate deaminase
MAEEKEPEFLETSCNSAAHDGYLTLTKIHYAGPFPVQKRQRCEEAPAMSARLINPIATALIVAAETIFTLVGAPAAAQTPPLTRDVISPPAAATRAPLPISPGVRVGDVIYVSGQVELDAPDITGQATSVLKKVQAVVEAAGTTMSKVDKCTVFLTRQADFASMNEVWRTFFLKDPPARTTVIVAALARAEFLIEIECNAHR